jgi:hypothetical protein
MDISAIECDHSCSFGHLCGRASFSIEEQSEGLHQDQQHRNKEEMIDVGRALLPSPCSTELADVFFATFFVLHARQ